MKVILDTSPICFLVLIGEIEILPRLFAEVVAPKAVLQELRHPKAPELVREWALRPPSWLAVVEANTEITAKFDFLDPGESEAIALGIELRPSLVLLDDAVAREEALKQGLEISGLLGVLGEAGKKGLVDLGTSLLRLQETHFRVSPALIQKILAQAEASPR